jgi:hypothetical protein
MGRPAHANPALEAGKGHIREKNAHATRLLRQAIESLRATVQDEPIMEETPFEVRAAIDSAIKAMGTALRCLKTPERAEKPTAALSPDGPTRQQGQFLAFIREYMKSNEAGVAPTHAAFQQFFNLAAPSVNSMLIRLEKRGFIRRVPGKARGTELTIDSEQIPPLERPFKFRIADEDSRRPSPSHRPVRRRVEKQFFANCRLALCLHLRERSCRQPQGQGSVGQALELVALVPGASLRVLGIDNHAEHAYRLR